jgi:hypothetical protein
MLRTILFCFYLICTTSILGQEQFHAFGQSKREKRKSNAIQRRKLWNEQPYHIYLGLDLASAFRQNTMRLVNAPAYIKSMDTKDLSDGRATVRLYLGVLFKRTNHLEIAWEILPSQVFSQIKSIDTTKITTGISGLYFGDFITHSLFSIAYKRDVIPHSKIFKLLPGLVFGLGYGDVPNFGIKSSPTTVQIGKDTYTLVDSFDSYTIKKAFPVVGGLLDCDFNIRRVTLGIKFRLNYSPVTVWGTPYIVTKNNQPPDHFKVETNIFNFNLGVGIRYTF